MIVNIILSLIIVVLLLALLVQVTRNAGLLLSAAKAHQELGSLSAQVAKSNELLEYWRREAHVAQVEAREGRAKVTKLYERMVTLTQDRVLDERPDGQFDDATGDPPSVRAADRAATEARRIKAVPIDKIESERVPVRQDDSRVGEDDDEDGEG